MLCQKTTTPINTPLLAAHPSHPSFPLASTQLAQQPTQPQHTPDHRNPRPNIIQPLPPLQQTPRLLPLSALHHHPFPRLLTPPPKCPVIPPHNHPSPAQHRKRHRRRRAQQSPWFTRGARGVRKKSPRRPAEEGEWRRHEFAAVVHELPLCEGEGGRGEAKAWEG